MVRHLCFNGHFKYLYSVLDNQMVTTKHYLQTNYLFRILWRTYNGTPFEIAYVPNRTISLTHSLDCSLGNVFIHLTPRFIQYVAIFLFLYFVSLYTIDMIDRRTYVLIRILFGRMSLGCSEWVIGLLKYNVINLIIKYVNNCFDTRQSSICGNVWFHDPRFYGLFHGKIDF